MNKIVARLILLFVVAQLIGITILCQYIDFKTTATTGITTTNNGNYVIAPEPVMYESYSFIAIGLAIVVATGLIFLIIKFNAMLLWRVWFFGTVLIGLVYAFYPLLKLFVQPTTAALIVALVMAVPLGFFKIFKPNYFAHTLSELFIYGGIAGIFVPALNLTSAIILLVLLAGYDYYMVNKSKDMVTLAKASIDSNLIAGLYVGDIHKKNEEHVADVQNHHHLSNDDEVINVAQQRHSAHKTSRHVHNTHDLGNNVENERSSAMIGGGDIAFPLFFAGAVMKFTGTLTSGLLVVTGATAGLIWLFSISQRGKFYPAIPFIAVGCFVALGIAILI